MEESQIQKFYKGRNVFITGGTGFMGKALIEKLLRETDVETIYVLIREKKGKTPHMRIDSLFDDVIFDRVKIEKPKCRNKVEAIPGDCTIAGLGISIIDRQKLISNIDVVFHVAATVNFNEHLKLAYNINLNGTKDLLNLAREMKNLKSIIHVSTAYSNCQRIQINEEIYDHPVKSSDLEALLEKMTDEEVSSCEPKILGEWPNTYTFTKALAESLVKEMSGTMPLGVFRPGIVISTCREPVPGWIDNLYGPTGVAVGTISGVLRVSPCDTSKRADLVPVDTCVCGLIASAWDVAERKEERKPDNIPVYNYVASPENPILWDEFLKLNFLHGVNYTPSSAIWCPYAVLTTNVYLYWILRLLLHTLPAFFIDLVTYAIGGKPKLLKVYKKIHKFSELVAFFCMREWNFTNSNTQKLWKKLNKTDQDLFPLSMTTVHWTMYFRIYVKGVRKYLLKDDDSTLERSRIKNKRFMLVHKILTIFFVCLTSYIFISCISRLYNCILGI
ncbi:fatty acyl-CoA reductase wat-like isoform X2 [Anthonomus grandis grandis]|nr:fatty acyl-CoA reductase wat-like isoform X2 [Anthonomus grandis grandis]XP_050316286.1 fatty acyl-CoA reductase wat-like isoform X2 [Anthonomus grandis grandis]